MLVATRTANWAAAMTPTQGESAVRRIIHATMAAVDEVRIGQVEFCGTLGLQKQTRISDNRRMSRRFIGGLRVFPSGTTKPRLVVGANATRPLAELLIDDEQRRVLLRLRGKWVRTVAKVSGRSHRVTYEWEAPLDSVTAE